VEDIDKEAITLSHPEIPALKWPAMTMEFRLAPGLKLPPGLAAGDQVDVEFRVPAPGEAEITGLARTATPAKGKP
jgi:membrane fusion protein, copper/silver efflux system